MTYQRRRGQSAQIWRTEVHTDRRGNTTKAATSDGPHEIRCWVIPQRSSRAEVPGQQQINIIRLGVDADLVDVEIWSRVFYAGKYWDIVTPPEYHHGTRRHTRHWSIDLRERPNG